MGLKSRLLNNSFNEENGNEPVKATISKSIAQPKIAKISTPVASHYHELKEKIHRRLLDRIDLTRLESVPKDVLRKQVREVVEGLLAETTEIGVDLNRERLSEEILNETFGLGPLEPLLNDESVTDILVNTHKQVYVERFGKLEMTNTVFKDEAHLLNIIDRIVSRIGRRVDEACPMVDARLPDGSRVNAIIPPLAIDGASVSIRKFGVHKFSVEDLLRLKSLTPGIARTLEGAVRARLNILVSGGTGSGKTTLLNILSSNIPENERIVTIEDAAELQLQQEHVVRLETRPANLEGKGTVTQRDLVKNALRMRPDRIVVGEVRGGEALDMLQAMNTGHDGSITTLHANTPRDALRRLETMILMSGGNLTDRAMREQIASAINVIVQGARLSDGTRKVICVSEVTGMEGETVTLQDIFIFKKFGISEDGKVIGAFQATGIRPKFADKLETSGIHLPAELFDPNHNMEFVETTE